MTKPISAGIIPIHYFDGIKKYLILRVGNYFDFPKGEHKDPELLKETAIRETKEECNLSNPNFKWGMFSYNTEPYGSRGKIAFYYIAEFDNIENVFLPINVELGKPEHEAFYWVTYEECLKFKLCERIVKVLNWAEEITKE